MNPTIFNILSVLVTVSTTGFRIMWINLTDKQVQKRSEGNARSIAQGDRA
ncbi:MAG: hypothetical protein ACD_21C00332G0001, partial [uncultured bacterium]